MTYRSYLGQLNPPAAAAKAVPSFVSALPRPTLPPVDPLSIVPAECATLERSSIAPDPVPAQTVVVTSWPLVTATDSEVQAWFGEVLGNPAGTGGPALLSGIGTLPEGTTLVSAGAGFMRDPYAAGTGPNGMLWLSMSFSAAVPRVRVQRIMQDVMQRAMSASVAPKVGSPRTTAPIVAAGESDQDLQAAATKSAIAQLSVASVFGAALGVVGNMTRPASLSTGSVVSAAADVNNAVGIISRANDLVSQVDSSIATALAAPPDQAPTMQQMLTAAKSQIVSMRSTVQRAAASAPTIRDQATSGRSNLVKSIRDQVVSGVESKVTGQPGFIREVAKCQYLTAAERVLRGDIARLEEALNSSLLSALTLIASPDQVNQTLTLLDELNARIDRAIDQLPLSWLEREWNGAPVWAWMTGGGALFLGGIVFIRYRRRKSAAPLVAKNRRRGR